MLEKSWAKYFAENIFPAIDEERTGIDLIHQCIVGLSSEMAKLMKINTGMRRMDSLMVASNIKK